MEYNHWKIEAEEISSIVQRIHLFNHMWKLFQTRYGKQHALTEMVGQQKTDLQNTLVRLHKKEVILTIDKKAGKKIVSISLMPEASCPWRDAAHIPLEKLNILSQSLVQGDL